MTYPSMLFGTYESLHTGRKPAIENMRGLTEVDRSKVTQIFFVSLPLPLVIVAGRKTLLKITSTGMGKMFTVPVKSHAKVY